jgi:Peptidase family M28
MTRVTTRSSLFALVVMLCAHATVHADPLRLKPVAAAHIDSTHACQGETMLLGRLGGSDAERASAKLMLEQLSPYLDEVHLESFELKTHRPVSWTIAPRDGASLTTVMPAPFDARFEITQGAWQVQWVREDADWDTVRGKWAYVRAAMDGGPSRTNVRRDLLYQKAVALGAAGFLFSLSFQEGRWQVVVPVDKPYAVPDARYPGGYRPIPAFSMDSVDGKAVEEAALSGAPLDFSLRYENEGDTAPSAFDALNTVGVLYGPTDRHLAIVAHLDSFFDGANDNASGLATFVGLAQALSEIPRSERLATFHFVAISSHHDEGKGMRAWSEMHEALLDSLEALILVEHTDAVPGDLAGTDLSENLRDLRAAYLGDDGWPEVEAALPELVMESGLMTRAPRMVHGCIADLFVVCDRVQPFCLIMAPIFYHTNHDTLDKITEEGLQRSVDFHLRLLAVIGALPSSVISP